MEFHVTGRQVGKTHQLLQWMRKAPPGEVRIYVGHNVQAAMDVYRSTFTETNEYGDKVSEFESWQFVGIQEAMKPGGWSAVRRFNPEVRLVLGIDNLDLVLRQMLYEPIGRVTATGIPIAPSL